MQQYISQRLNVGKPQHPPDIYFIRRNPQLLEKYLNQKEMDQLIKEASPKFKFNYNLFKLDPIEKEIIKTLKNQKRNFLNPNDPFYTNYRDHYQTIYQNLCETEKVTNIISPRNHSNLLNKDNDYIRNRSKELMSAFCDREHYYYKGKDGQQSVFTKDESNIKPLSKHQKIRQQKDELEKLDRIERELNNSIQLRQICHPKETEEFETITNKEFNKNFEIALQSSIETSLNESTLKRKFVRKQEPTTISRFQVDESQLKQFTFKQRYSRNVNHGRNTSTLGKSLNQSHLRNKSSIKDKSQIKQTQNNDQSNISNERYLVKKLSFSFPHTAPQGESRNVTETSLTNNQIKIQNNEAAQSISFNINQ